MVDRLLGEPPCLVWNRRGDRFFALSGSFPLEAIMGVLMAKIDHIKALIDKLELAVEDHADQVASGWSTKDETEAEERRFKAREALLQAIEKELR
jgi:hypothetical protein